MSRIFCAIIVVERLVRNPKGSARPSAVSRPCTIASHVRLEEIIERYSHGIIVGSLVGFDLSHELSGLVYWNGQYIEISPARRCDRADAQVGITACRRAWPDHQ